MEKFRENFLQVMGPLLQLLIGLEDVWNKSSEAVDKPAGIFATLTEQTTLLFGQASLSTSHTRRLNILKTQLKDPHKAKTLLKEKTASLQEDENHLFGKKFRSHIMEIEHSKKKSLWKFLRVVMRKILPFEKAVYLIKMDRKADGDTITQQNQVIETKTKMFDFKTTRVQVPESSIM